MFPYTILNAFDRNKELDIPITYSECRKAIKALKKCKATGEDKLLNEYFIEASSDVLAGLITEIFNKILATCVFSEAWTPGLIIPIHKKSRTSDASNYRGNTLLAI